MLRLFQTASFLAVLLLVGTSGSAHAYVSYHRMGYVSCSSCHSNPVGGGVLTSYGQSLQAALSAFSQELDLKDRRLNVALQARSIGFSQSGPANPFLMQADLLGLARLRENLSLQASLGPNLQRRDSFATVPSGADALVVRRALLQWQLSDESTIQAGRDFPVQGLQIDDHTSFLKRTNRRNILDYPTQFRFIRQTDSMQLIPYVSLPSFEEADSNREYGAGIRSEFSLNDRNSVGAEAFYGNTPTLSRAMAGAFFRLSHDHWNALLGEGLVTRFHQHASDTGFTQANLYLRPSISFPEWAETSFIYEVLNVGEPYSRNLQQWGPELNLRIHEWISLIGDGRQIRTPNFGTNDWIWFGQVFLHVQI
jgi:hypothetical protein